MTGSPAGFWRFGGIGVAMISCATLRPCAAPVAILIFPLCRAHPSRLALSHPLAGRFFEKLVDVVRRERVMIARHVNAGTLKKLLALILHQVHGGRSVRSRLKLVPCWTC